MLGQQAISGNHLSDCVFTFRASPPTAVARGVPLGKTTDVKANRASRMLSSHAIATLTTTIAYPICTDGHLACPPEDCGGIGGFYDLLDALRNPTHEQHEELQDWVGGDYDPEAFSMEAVNRVLTRLVPRRSARSSRGAMAR